jgi:hypothetical protein
VQVSIADVAHAIARAMDFQGQVVFDVSKPDGQFRKVRAMSYATPFLYAQHVIWPVLNAAGGEQRQVVRHAPSF